MNSLSVVDGFYIKTRAKGVATVQRAKVKESGRKAKVRVEDAYMMYVKHEWFRKKVTGKLPQPGQFTVIVYYTTDKAAADVAEVNATTVIEIPCPPQVTAIKKFRKTAVKKLVSVLPVRSSQISTLRFSPKEIKVVIMAVLVKSYRTIIHLNEPVPMAA